MADDRDDRIAKGPAKGPAKGTAKGPAKGTATEAGSTAAGLGEAGISGASQAQALSDLAAAKLLGQHWYASFLGFKRCDTPNLQERLLSGFNYGAFQKLQDELGLNTSELGELIQIRPRTLARRRNQGRLLPAESDRLLRAARVFGLALELFEGDRDATRRWLASPSRALGGSSPLVLARTGIGAREVERLIGRLEHGVAS